MPAHSKLPKKKVGKVDTRNTFATFLADPLVATALIAFALIALVLSIIEFSQAIAY